MKEKLLVLCLSVLLFAVSCNDHDETITQDSLEGIWHLNNVSGGIQGIDLDYDQGDVVWNFTMAESSVKVESTILTNGPKSIYQGLISGTYAIGFEEQDATRTMLIDGIKFRILEIQSTTLILDDGVAADGFVRRFVK